MLQIGWLWYNRQPSAAFVQIQRKYFYLHTMPDRIIPPRKTSQLFEGAVLKMLFSILASGQTCWIAHGQSVGVFRESWVQARFLLATQTADVRDVPIVKVWKRRWQLRRLFSWRSSSRRPEVPCSVPAWHGSLVQLLACVHVPQFSKDTECQEMHVQAWTSGPECGVECARLSYLILKPAVGGGVYTKAGYQHFNPPSGRAPCLTASCALKCVFWQNSRMLARNVSSATGQRFTCLLNMY